MNKRFVLVVAIMVLLSVGTIGAVTLRDFVVRNTEMHEYGYGVSIQGYDHNFYFDLDEVDVGNIREKISERLDIIDAVKEYDARLSDGRDGCSTTTECHEWGWLPDTICYRGRCIDSDKTNQIDDELDTNTSKKDELDQELLGAKP